MSVTAHLSIRLYAGRRGARPMTVEDLWAIPRVGVPVPSPDGTRLAVTVTTYDLETNEGLVIAPADAPGRRSAEEAGDRRWFGWDELPALGPDPGLRLALATTREPLALARRARITYPE